MLNSVVKGETFRTEGRSQVKTIELWAWPGECASLGQTALRGGGG